MTHVSSTSLSRRERDLLINTMVLLGGKFNPDLTEATDLLVAGRVGSEKYAFAKENSFAVVTMRWVKACKASMKILPPAGYEMLPLHGLHFSITGFEENKREMLIESIRRGGGIYSGDMKMNISTHLIAEDTTSSKYSYAIKWGNVLVVASDWIALCLKLNHWVSETPYIIKPKSCTLRGEKRRIALLNQGGESKERKTAEAALEIQKARVISHFKTNGQVIDSLRNRIILMHGCDDSRKWRDLLFLVRCTGATVYWEWNSSITDVLIGDTPNKDYISYLKQQSDIRILNLHDIINALTLQK